MTNMIVTGIKSGNKYSVPVKDIKGLARIDVQTNFMKTIIRILKMAFGMKTYPKTATFIRVVLNKKLELGIGNSKTVLAQSIDVVETEDELNALNNKL